MCVLLIVPLTLSERARGYAVGKAGLGRSILAQLLKVFFYNCPFNQEEHEGTEWGRPGPGLLGELLAQLYYFSLKILYIFFLLIVPLIRKSTRACSGEGQDQE